MPYVGCSQPMVPAELAADSSSDTRRTAGNDANASTVGQQLMMFLLWSTRAHIDQLDFCRLTAVALECSREFSVCVHRIDQLQRRISHTTASHVHSYRTVSSLTHIMSDLSLNGFVNVGKLEDVLQTLLQRMVSTGIVRMAVDCGADDANSSSSC